MNNNNKYFKNSYFVEVQLHDWMVNECQNNKDMFRINFWYPRSKTAMNVYVHKNDILTNNSPFAKSVRIWSNRTYFVTLSNNNKTDFKDMMSGNLIMFGLYDKNEREYIQQHSHTFMELNNVKEEKKEDKNVKATGKTAIKYGRL